MASGGARKVAGDVGGSQSGAWWPEDAETVAKTAPLAVASRCRAWQQQS